MTVPNSDVRRIGVRRWPRRVLIAVNCVVALCVIGVASAYGYAQWRLDQVHREKVEGLASVGGGKPFTLLVVGSDSRSALSGPDNAQFGSATDVSGQRSDTIILVRVVPDYRELMIMSIPRDLWVNIPGMGENRINAAFGSGPNLLVQTIKTDLGIPVNHYVEVDFDTFRDITDAVGGVKFYFPTPAMDSYSNLDIPAAGCVNLTGDQALAFVRSRHYEYYQDGAWQYEAESDLARIQRQQSFIKKMIKKAESEFTNPIALNDVIGGITKNLTVDSSLSNNTILDLAKDFHSMDASNIPTATLPNYGFVTSGGADVLGLQEPQAQQTIADFNSFGDTPPPSASAPSKSKAKTPSKSQTAPTTPPVTVAPSSVSIEVANGTGTAGQAGQMTQTLAALGYSHVGLTGNSPGQSVATTEILYAPDSLTAARQLAAHIPGGATQTESTALTPTPYNVEIVTGTSYGTATGATTATPTTTVPGANSQVYELPGSTGPPPANC